MNQDQRRNMQTVLEVLRKTETFLSRAGVETPKIDAEWILADSLGCRRLEVFLQWDRPLDENVLEILRERVKRRASREPLQYILGHVDFHDIRLRVREGVLIPRPETEELVEKLIPKLEGMSRPRIVDLGTGSGAIALALAKALPNSRVLAIDSSHEALSQARENADLLGLRERVSFRSGHWLRNLSFEADCIVSNPPYLTEEEWNEAAPEVRRHEPREALVSGRDGLEDLKEIVSAAFAQLAPGGFLALETGIAHGEPLIRLAREAGYREVQAEADANGRQRFLFARKEDL